MDDDPRPTAVEHVRGTDFLHALGFAHAQVWAWEQSGKCYVRAEDGPDRVWLSGDYDTWQAAVIAAVRRGGE